MFYNFNINSLFLHTLQYWITMSIQYTVLGFELRPLEHVFPPITTRRATLILQHLVALAKSVSSLL